MRVAFCTFGSLISYGIRPLQRDISLRHLIFTVRNRLSHALQLLRSLRGVMILRRGEIIKNQRRMPPRPGARQNQWACTVAIGLVSVPLRARTLSASRHTK
jgi:hypothetical protein